MRQRIVSFFLLSTVIVFVHSAFAESVDKQLPLTELGEQKNHPRPFITMNVGVEIAGLEAAATEAAEGLILIGESLEQLAENPELTEEHHKEINKVLSRVNDLGQSLNLTVARLPASVEQSMGSIREASDQLSGHIKQTVIITAIVLVFTILAALAAVYYFVLAPGTRSVIKTTALLGELADTLKSTADIVETSSKRNLEVMEEIHKLKMQREGVEST